MKLNSEQLRKQLKKQRIEQPKQQQIRLSAKISNRLSTAPIYLAAKNVALYLPANGEADPSSIVTKNTESDRRFYLPVLSPTGDKHLHFHQWDKNTRFTHNIYGISEPVINNQFVPTSQLDVIIMPLLGFDSKGNRLGMGGGYYDRTLSFKLENPTNTKPVLIAYAYAFQECETLQAQIWDVPFDYYVTENEFNKI